MLSTLTPELSSPLLAISLSLSHWRRSNENGPLNLGRGFQLRGLWLNRLNTTDRVQINEAWRSRRATDGLGASARAGREATVVTLSRHCCTISPGENLSDQAAHNAIQTQAAAQRTLHKSHSTQSLPLAPSSAGKSAFAPVLAPKDSSSDAPAPQRNPRRPDEWLSLIHI